MDLIDLLTEGLWQGDIRGHANLMRLLFQPARKAGAFVDMSVSRAPRMRAGAGMAGLKDDVEDVVKKFQRSLAVLRTMEAAIVLKIRSNDNRSNGLHASRRKESKNGRKKKKLQQHDLQ